MITNVNVKKRAIDTYVAPLSRDELAVIIREAVTGLSKPQDTTAEAALECLGDEKVLWQRAAVACLSYFGECIAKANLMKDKKPSN